MSKQGLGLQNALLMFQQGRAWRDQQDQLAQQREREGKIKDANQAAIGYIESTKKAHEAEQAAALQEWTRTKGSGEGFQAKPWQTNDAVMFRAAAARGDALLGAGLFDEYAKNRAAIIPMQMQARRAAWERFQADGDHGALGQAMYDTVPNGRHVKAYDVAGAPGPDGKSKGKKLRFHMDDGTVQFMAPEQVEALAKRAMTDPAKVIENEFALDLWNAKQRAEAAAKKEVATHEYGLKGVLQDREMEGKLGLADRAHQNALGLAAVNNASAEKRTNTSAGAAVQAAKIRASADAGKPGDRVKSFDALHDQVRVIAGKVAGGPFGSTKLADEDTMNIARYAEALMEDDEEMSAGDAINQSITEFKKRRPAGK